MLRVKEVIKEKKTTIWEVAEKIGITGSAISMAIAGNPTIETLQKIANALDVPIAELFEHPKKDTIDCPNCGIKLKLEKD